MLWAAYKQTQEKGSSTACILKLKHDQLYGTNVGDSGFLVVRGSEVVFQSPHQQHSFNFPFQLGLKDPKEPKMASETPARAQVCPLHHVPSRPARGNKEGSLWSRLPQTANSTSKVMLQYSVSRTALL